MGDALQSLPTDVQVRNTPEELEVIQSLSIPKDDSLSMESTDSSSQPSVFSEILGVVIIGALFAVIASDFFGSLVNRFTPIADKWYYNLAIRTVIFIALYFLITNFALARKCKQSS